MNARDEWYVEFEVAHPERSTRDDIDRLVDDAIEWVEARSLGLGGGQGPAKGDVGKQKERWGFRGGICIQHYAQLISEELAIEFLGFLRSICEERGLGFAGKVEPFPLEESA